MHSSIIIGREIEGSIDIVLVTVVVLEGANFEALTARQEIDERARNIPVNNC